MPVYTVGQHSHKLLHGTINWSDKLMKDSEM